MLENPSKKISQENSEKVIAAIKHCLESRLHRNTGAIDLVEKSTKIGDEIKNKIIQDWYELYDSKYSMLDNLDIPLDNPARQNLLSDLKKIGSEYWHTIRKIYDY